MENYESVSFGGEFDRSEAVNYEARPLPLWFREPDDRADYKAYEPTPMMPNIDQETRNHQKSMHDSLWQLFVKDIPGDIPKSTQEIIENNYMANEAMRSHLNQSSYVLWMEQQPEVGGDISDIVTAAERGLASQSDLLYLMKNTTIQSTELSKLTHPYSYRMDYLDEMRGEVRQAIGEQSGENVYQAPYRSIQLFPQVEHIGNLDYDLQGFTATYKHDIGKLQTEDGRLINVVERQTVAVRLDARSGFDQDLANGMKQVAIGKDTEWPDRITEDTGFRDYIEAIIQSDEVPDYLLPLSTMIYAHEVTEDQTNSGQ